MTDRIVDRSSERPRAEICGGALCRHSRSNEDQQSQHRRKKSLWQRSDVLILRMEWCKSSFRQTYKCCFSFTPKHIQGIVTLWRWIYFRGLNQSKSPRVQLVFLWTHNMQPKELWIQELYQRPREWWNLHFFTFLQKNSALVIADSFFMVKKTREHISLRGVSTEVSISLSKSNIRGILQRVQYTMQTSYHNKDRKGRLDTNIYKNLNEPQKCWSSILWTKEAQISLQPKDKRKETGREDKTTEKA